MDKGGMYVHLDEIMKQTSQMISFTLVGNWVFNFLPDSAIHCLACQLQKSEFVTGSYTEENNVQIKAGLLKCDPLNQQIRLQTFHPFPSMHDAS